MAKFVTNKRCFKEDKHLLFFVVKIDKIKRLIIDCFL